MEEKQKNILIDNEHTSSVAFVAKSNNNRFSNANINQNKKFNRDRPFCTHFNFQGHTVEKCYTLHGYPPGYKPKTKNNQVNVVTNDNITVDSSMNDGLSNMFMGFSQAQCQQVMSALTNHMISVNPNENTATGNCYSLTIKSGLKPCMWILDSGASQHV